MRIPEMPPGKHQFGFTLAELLVTLFVFTLLASALGIAANSMLSNNRMVNTGNQLINDLNAMRGTALNRSQDITMCAANLSGDDCSSDNTWHNGWIIFVDDNANRSLDNGEEILRQQGPIGGGITITGNFGGVGNDIWVGYQGDGSVVQRGSLNVCPPNQTANNRRVVVPRIRRPWINRNGANCS